MKNDAAKPLSTDGTPAAATQPNAAPKQYTLREQIVIGLKLGISAGLFLLAIWLVEHS
ncbi:hypothetical protein [Pseudodesulfovibrio sp.]|uniref:hypothetical protein n=1 Tax=Pseudodesulfovibrio sp. TaxID=2035812 RepID=UPI002604C146|nr:hypothetical protein [Pseudodesulfovibrio sp.]MDD3311219.1 hypothetical protein [Pseudodesulfovibrio sp.]